jgi:hypothetical protein
MISGPGPSERRRSAPMIGAPPVAEPVPLVEYELMGVVMSSLLAERWFIDLPQVSDLESLRGAALLRARVPQALTFANKRS